MQLYQTLVGFSILNQIYLFDSPLNFYPTNLYIGTDNYEQFKKQCNSLLNNINFLEKEGFYCLHKHVKLPVETVWSGDGKFRRMILGRSSAKSIYPCPYCKVKSEELGDL